MRLSVIKKFCKKQWIRLGPRNFKTAKSQKRIPHSNENCILHAGTVSDALSAPGLAKWETAHSGRY